MNPGGFSHNMNNDRYPGKELHLFSKAVKWKSYWSSRILPYFGNTVLEVGAGLGANTRLLCKKSFRRWVCLEPDTHLSKVITENIKYHQCHSLCEVINGTILNLSSDDIFDTILYLDVLEHIKDDKEEIHQAYNHLSSNGKIVIIAPSHPFLFSVFDKAIGHYRRYNARMIRELTPPDTRLLRLEYLDSLGMLLSYTNRAILNQKIPNHNEIQIWDSIIVPCSRIFDKLSCFRLGKSILAVWVKIK